MLYSMQVGRKVAQVLESLGRSAETIQEAEVEFIYCCEPENKGLSISNFFFAIDHFSYSGEEVLQGEP